MGINTYCLVGLQPKQRNNLNKAKMQIKSVLWKNINKVEFGIHNWKVDIPIVAEMKKEGCLEFYSCLYREEWPKRIGTIDEMSVRGKQKHQ